MFPVNFPQGGARELKRGPLARSSPPMGRGRSLVLLCALPIAASFLHVGTRASAPALRPPQQPPQMLPVLLASRPAPRQAQQLQERHREQVEQMDGAMRADHGGPPIKRGRGRPRKSTTGRHAHEDAGPARGGRGVPRTAVGAGAAGAAGVHGRVVSTAPARRGRGRPRGSGRGMQSEGQAEVTSYVQSSIEQRGKLLAHAEEIQLCTRVQRLQALEQLYDAEVVAARNASAAADADAAAPQPAPTAREATVEGGGPLAADWAAAAGVSEDELSRQLAAGVAARGRIVEANVGLVRSLIYQLKRRSGGRIDSGTTEQDLLQEGLLSLLRAAQGFDVELGVRFSTYATFWIRAAIKQALHEQSRVVRLPTRVQDTYGKIKRAKKALEVQSEVPPTDDEVSTHLGESGTSLSPQRVREIQHLVLSRTGSLNSAVGGRGMGGGGEGAREVMDVVPDPRLLVEEGLVRGMLRTHLGTLMERHLTPDEARVVALRFGLEDGASRTIRAAGEEIGVSYPHSKKLLFSALAKLRKPHVALALRDYMTDDDL